MTSFDNIDNIDTYHHRKWMMQFVNLSVFDKMRDSMTSITWSIRKIRSSLRRSIRSEFKK